MAVDGFALSRDGDWVAYVTFPEGVLWRSRIDGSQRLQLTFPPMRVVLPRWSPDGKQIAFMAIAPGKPMKISLVSTEGGSSQQLLAGERNEMDPNWSPDGNSLVFCPAPSLEAETPGNVAIHILDLKTHQAPPPPDSHRPYAPHRSPH